MSLLTPNTLSVAIISDRAHKSHLLQVYYHVLISNLFSWDGSNFRIERLWSAEHRFAKTCYYVVFCPDSLSLLKGIQISKRYTRRWSEILSYAQALLVRYTQVKSGNVYRSHPLAIAFGVFSLWKLGSHLKNRLSASFHCSMPLGIILLEGLFGYFGMGIKIRNHT